MKVLKGILNVFGIIFGFIFSIVLVATLVAAPVVSGAASLLQPKNLQKIVSEIDVEALAEDLIGDVGGEGAEILEVFFEEGIVVDILDLYIEDLFAELNSESGPKKLTEEAVIAILEDSMDVFVEMAKETMDEESLQYITDEEIKEQLRTEFAMQAQNIIYSMPSLNEIGMSAEITEVMGAFQGGEIATAGIFVVGVFAFIVFLCQFPRFKSFMWLGIDFLIGGGISYLAASSIGVIMDAGLVSIPFGEDIVQTVLGVLASSVKMGAFIELGLAVLFIVIFIVGRVLLKKKKVARAAEQVVIDQSAVAPAVEEAIAEEPTAEEPAAEEAVAEEPTAEEPAAEEAVAEEPAAEEPVAEEPAAKEQSEAQ